MDRGLLRLLKLFALGFSASAGAIICHLGGVLNVPALVYYPVAVGVGLCAQYLLVHVFGGKIYHSLGERNPAFVLCLYAASALLLSTVATVAATKWLAPPPWASVVLFIAALVASTIFMLWQLSTDDDEEEPGALSSHLSHLKRLGIDTWKVTNMIWTMDNASRALFLQAVYGGSVNAEMAYFPENAPTRRDLIIFGKIGELHRLHEIARSLPDIVMEPNSIDHPEYYRGRVPSAERYHYWCISKNLLDLHGPLVRVSYLSHFPKFEIVFEYQDGFKLCSGERTGSYDVHFLRLGYVGEGPRYTRVFLAAAGLHLSQDEIASIHPGDAIELTLEGASIIRG
jgi:hypothetical protein